MLVVSDQLHERVLLMPVLDPDVPTEALTPSSVLGGLDGALGVTLFLSRYVVIADAGNDRVVVFDASTNGWSSFDSFRPRRVSADGAGRLLVVGDGAVTRYDNVNGMQPEELTPELPGRRPVAACAQGGARVDVALDDGSVRRSTDDGATWITVGLPGPQRTSATAMAAGASGPSYLADVANGRVVAIAGDGSVSTVLGPAHGVVSPAALAVDGDDLFVADAATNRIRWFALGPANPEPAEYVNGVASDGTYRFDRVGGIAVGGFA